MSVPNAEKYEAVIGLEVHAQISSSSKVYSGDSAAYGDLPNTNINPISLGHPGTLPKLNHKVLESAIKMGLACGCDITKENQFARKNYFYADLPKGYQITQDKTPICTGGGVTIDIGEEKKKTINLIRIHMEEDSGKSIHDQDPYNTLIDLNRAGVGLIEIVSAPDLRSGEEAYTYLAEVRRLVRYLDICDGNMEEGSLRCDANVSVRLKGSESFGQRTEVKNMNSLRNVQKAIEYEISRQIETIENGGEVFLETRSFNAATGLTSVMRSKEEAHDYRYFPEPDLQYVIVENEDVNAIKEEMPALPNELLKKYQEDFGLSKYDSQNLVESKSVALYFQEVSNHTKSYKSAANWVMGPVKSAMNQRAVGIQDLQIKPEELAELVELIHSGKVSNSLAEQKLFPLMLEGEFGNVEELAKQHGLIQESNDDVISQYVKEVIEQNEEEVGRYRNGETKLMGFFMGQLMKVSKGKADPKKATNVLKKELEQL